MTTYDDVERMTTLAEQLGKLFDAALAVTPGGTIDFAWRSVLAANGVAPVADDDRAVLRGALGFLRGALPSEVEACVVATAERIDPALRDKARATWILFAPIYLERARYRESNVYAHALASARTNPRAHWFRPPGGFVMRCTTCGGPRLSVESALDCQFCESGKLSVNP